MSFFSTTQELKHRTPIPRSVPREKLLQCIHDHDLLIRLDPEFASYETLPPPQDGANPKTKYYKVTDHMHTLPAGLWDTTVSFNAEITDIDDGVEWVIKAPMGLLQKTFWRVTAAGPDDKCGDEQAEWCLVEAVEIKCNRVLMGTIVKKCEGNWQGIHNRFVERASGTTTAVAA